MTGIRRWSMVLAAAGVVVGACSSLGAGVVFKAGFEGDSAENFENGFTDGAIAPND